MFGTFGGGVSEVGEDLQRPPTTLATTAFLAGIRFPSTQPGYISRLLNTGHQSQH
jgi:hypothetical protein